MKSTNLITFKIILFGILLQTLFLCISATKIKSTVTFKNSSTGTKDEELRELISKMFKVAQCPANKKKDGEQTDLDKAQNENIGVGGSWAIPKSKYNKYDKRLYGWGPSAYLFDYIDPVLEQPILNSFQKLWDEVKNQSVFATEDEKNDPYTLKKIFNMPDQPDDVLLARFASLKPSFKKDVWEKSVTVPQVRAVAKSWNYNPSAVDYAREIVDTYDYNGDGRLSPKEFLIAYLNINRALMGTKDCPKFKDANGAEKESECIHSVIKLILNPIFLRVDCADYDDKISAEELWEALRYIKRVKADDKTKEETRYDIYFCKIFGEDYHTTAVNDFILKSQKTIDGYLNKLEFSRGIFLGYWARSVDDLMIHVPSSQAEKGAPIRNMKDRRWTQSSNEDTRCKLMSNSR